MPNLAIPRKQRKNIAQSWEGKKTTHISNLPRTVNGGKLSNDNQLPLLSIKKNELDSVLYNQRQDTAIPLFSIFLQLNKVLDMRN